MGRRPFPQEMNSKNFFEKENFYFQLGRPLTMEEKKQARQELEWEEVPSFTKWLKNHQRMIKVGVVIMIIGLGMGIGGWWVQKFGYLKSFKKVSPVERDLIRQKDLERLRSAILFYLAQNTHYPRYNQIIDVSTLAADLKQFLPDIPKDPGGINSYFYQTTQDSGHFILFARLEGSDKPLTTPAGFDFPPGYNYFLSDQIVK
jgi:hypothetical protein